jgi:hypothetical protein
MKKQMMESRQTIPPRNQRHTMATAQFNSGNADLSDAREAQKALIRRQVVSSLGTPDDLLKVLVHPVGQESFRVNVMVGKSAAAARIADSFFLTADGDGNILTSSPQIARLY